MIRVLLCLCCLLLQTGIHAYVVKFEGQFKEYESHVLDLIGNFIPEDPIVFEAGGHYGNDTVNFANHWPKGEIHSFEPNPNAFKKLCEATQGCQNVKAYNLAVADFNGKAILNVCYGSTGDNPIFEGASSLLRASPYMEVHYQGPKVEVDCVTLDRWCEKNEIDHIDFMWLDLEGMELQVLWSSPKILDTVKVIYTETNFAPFRMGMTQYHHLKPFLESAGFMLLSHWYTEGYQGNAIFVKKELFEPSLP